MPEADIHQPQSTLPTFQLPEPYINLFLGAAVVVLAAVAIFLVGFFRNHFTPVRSLRKEVTSAKTVNMKNKIAQSNSNDQKNSPESGEKKYTIQSGDSLWTIAEAQYGTGYKWVDIAKANNLTNPGMLFKGTVLTLPAKSTTNIAVNTNAKTLPTIGQESATNQTTQSQQTTKSSSGTYTVQHGDNLWAIAVREYNDGYRWGDIAKANNLANPRIIHAGNVLVIPQNNNP